MAKNKMALTRRAWKLVRLALFWVRKNGFFKPGLMVDLLPNYLKNIRTTTRDSILYGERQFSFNETPIIHFKLHKPNSLRFRIPCINPPVNFEDEERIYDQNGRKSYRSEVDEDYDCGYVQNDRKSYTEEEQIDSKADEFIARFYDQMRMQRQVSYLQYNEMLHRGTI
ncbi:uncharacterized protein LOC143852294 [Tasmannia lanceolata]|uniref:uncharacterized protein LOC143852294 n=1 Tax=Tasmannia lanceolata TaxID=3420 RepID=UPI004064BA0A